MQRFFFHLHERGAIVEDGEGLECASLEQAFEIATAAARDIVIGGVRQGLLDLQPHISITDDANVEVGVLRFRDAIAVAGD